MPPRPLTKTAERDVLKAVTDLLSAHKIWFERRNTGAFGGTHNGRKRFVRFGTPGVADVMAWVRIPCYCGIQHCALNCRKPVLLWIECKSKDGRQTPEQKAFQLNVLDQGMDYLVVRDVDELVRWLKNRGIQ